MTEFHFPYIEFRFPRTPAFSQTVRSRPMIPVVLSHGEQATEVYAIIDSGADTTIFSDEIAQLLGLRVRDGIRETFVGTSGRPQVVHYHDLTIGFRSGEAEKAYEARVGFSRLPADVAGLLGQIGFLDRFSVTLNQPRQEITLRFED